jgi:membrane associated rhomboid family serine protease
MVNLDRLAKWPSGSLFLGGMAVLLYLALSRGTFYIPDAELGGLAFHLGNPLAIVSHLFVHVGVLHLVGNLVPLLAFALVLERHTSAFDAVAVFLFGGALSAVVFSLLNPGTALVGASAAIASLMGALAALRPRESAVLLLVLPLLVTYVAVPTAASLQQKQEVQLVQAAQTLQQNVTTLVVQNRTQEAVQVNQTLQQVTQQVAITQKGKERERITPTDFLVHAYGAAFGIVYLYLFRRRKLSEGMAQYHALREWLEHGPGTSSLARRPSREAPRRAPRAPGPLPRGRRKV